MPQDDEREFDEEADCIASYYAAVAELRRRFLAREVLPERWRPEGKMICRKCGRLMYRQDIDGRENWHCPDRLDGTHGEWHSMPVEVMRVSPDEYERICAQLGIVDNKL